MDTRGARQSLGVFYFNEAESIRRDRLGRVLGVRVNRWLLALIVIAVACGGVDTSSGQTTDPPASTTSTSGAPVTTHEGLTTTLVRRPSVGDGRENPMPVGGAMTVGGWSVVVEGRTESNVTGSPNRVLVAVAVTASYVRVPGQGSFFEDLALTALGNGGAIYVPVQEGCAEALVHTGGSLAGDTIGGSICFVVDGEVGDFQLIVEDENPQTPHRVYLATE